MIMSYHAMFGEHFKCFSDSLISTEKMKNPGANFASLNLHVIYLAGTIFGGFYAFNKSIECH